MKKLIILLLTSLLLVAECRKNKDNDDRVENNGSRITDGPTPENPTSITNQEMTKD